jgi:hypothetical protein
MATEAQVVANRRNAKKSTGPRTTQGRAVVAQNAIQHGLLARQDLITGEDPQQFELGRRETLGELAPVGVMETVLAERIVSLTWRLKRAQRLQNEVFDYLLARELKDSMRGFYDELSPEEEERLRSKPDTDPGVAVGRMVTWDYSHERVQDRLMMYERRIENSLYRTMNELHKLRLMRDKDGGHNAPRETLGSRVAPPNSFDGADSTKPDHPKPHGQTSLPVPPRDCAKQSQFTAEEDSHGQPVEAQHLASPSAGPSTEEPTRADRDLACETKPIEAAGSVCSVSARASEETPCGVTTNAKQSQCRASAAGVRAVLRPRPRVACHSHNVARSY